MAGLQRRAIPHEGLLGLPDTCAFASLVRMPQPLLPGWDNVDLGPRLGVAEGVQVDTLDLYD